MATRIIERDGAGEMLLVRKSRLTVVEGPSADQAVEIGATSVRVGSDPACDLVLSDSSVSAQHFSIAPTQQGFLLRDLGSTNGTFVEGLSARELFLPARAQILVGESRLEFVAGDAELEVPLSNRTRCGDLLGHSDAMRQVFHVIERVARTDTTVLIEGESGTGKELAARALHERSGRAGPFMAIDCGAIPASLIESELFGHRKGAFTGAVADKAGPFEEAEGGTILLDEVGELPLDLQPKLLRALESRTIRRVGDTQVRSYDARLLAATNRNLAQEVAEGRFRQDLYFRLSVIKLRLPPLRERREEIPRLVAHFLGSLGVDASDPSRRVPQSIMALLASHHWPGNVRELRNVVERLALLPGMAPQFYLGSGDPQGAAGASRLDEGLLELPFHQGKRELIDRFERSYLERMLERCGGNVSELARVSGLSRQSCHRLLNRHGLL